MPGQMPFILDRQPRGWIGLIFQAYGLVLLSTDAALVIQGHGFVERDEVTFADDFRQMVIVPVEWIAVIPDIAENIVNLRLEVISGLVLQHKTVGVNGC